jgi:RNA polymerase-associated protein
VVNLYDAPRCPYCARVRILLAEKQIPYESVEIDLQNRPAWLYAKNPAGKVPVLEEDGFVLPESRVIMEYLEDRYPEPALMPTSPAERSLVRLWLERFDDLAQPYYRVVFDDEPADDLDVQLGKLDAALAATPYLAGPQFSLADIGYVPWIIRAQERADVGVGGHENLRRWVDRLAERPSIATERALVAAIVS